MMKTEIPVEAVGSLALEICKQNLQGIVMGCTSKGLFLRFENDQLIFCSREAFRGPFTINFSNPGILPMMDEGPVIVRDQMITLGDEFCIYTKDSHIWLSPQLDPKKRFHPSLEDARLVGKYAVEDQKTDYPVRLLGHLGNIQSDGSGPVSRWEQISQSIANHSLLEFVSAIKEVVGYGRGLTPSGDDFILGVMLGCARYGGTFGIDIQLEREVVESILETTRATTLISRQLIMAAMNGKADERLISAFDGWMFHDLDGKQIYTILRTWGNSSGVDAFTGWVSYLLMKNVI